MFRVPLTRVEEEDRFSPDPTESGHLGLVESLFLDEEDAVAGERGSERLDHGGRQR